MTDPSGKVAVMTGRCAISAAPRRSRGQRLARTSSASMRRGRSGRIIVISWTQEQHGTKHGATYAASTWGIIGPMKSTALEFGEHKVTVNALIPGLIDTALNRHEDRYAQAIEEGGKQPIGDEATEERLARQAMLAKTPLEVPWVDLDDIAPMVVFIASDAARMVSGGSDAVTGGDSVHGGS